MIPTENLYLQYLYSTSKTALRDFLDALGREAEMDFEEYTRRQKAQEPTIADLLFKPGAEAVEFDGDERVK